MLEGLTIGEVFGVVVFVIVALAAAVLVVLAMVVVVVVVVVCVAAVRNTIIYCSDSGAHYHDALIECGV